MNFVPALSFLPHTHHPLYRSLGLVFPFLLPASSTMAHSPKFEVAIYLPDNKFPSHSLKRPFRRKRRIPILLFLPFTLFLLYFLLPSWLDQSELFLAPPPYLSHAGKAALGATIVLPKIQYNFAKGEGADPERREQVKETILRTWRLYAQEAWGWDEVRPVEGGGRDSRYLPQSCSTN